MNKLFLCFLSLTLCTIGSFALAAGSATFSLGSPGKSVEVGQQFSIPVNINPGGSAVDTARVQISYSGPVTANSFALTGRLTSASPGNGINAGAGTISWGAFTVDSAITNPGGFGRITFTANAVGEATIRVLSSSKLISNGEEVGNPGGFGSTTVRIVPSTADPASAFALSSPTHPDQEKWYQANTAQFKWSRVGDAQYTWEFDQSPDTIPTKATSDQTKQIKAIKNGVWYFHLGTSLPQNSTKVVAHYRVRVDNLKPNPVEPYLDISNREDLILNFATTDYHSGIASYDLQINSEELENVTSPYAVRGLTVGNNQIIVKAFDNAGNERTGWIKFILDADGTIRDITTSGDSVDFCSIVPVLCTTTWPLFAGLALLLIALFVLFNRRRVNTMAVKTITKTNLGTVSKVITKTDPKTGKQLITKTITKTDTKNIVETDQGTLTKDVIDEDSNLDENSKSKK